MLKGILKQRLASGWHQHAQVLQIKAHTENSIQGLQFCNSLFMFGCKRKLLLLSQTHQMEDNNTPKHSINFPNNPNNEIQKPSIFLPFSSPEDFGQPNKMEKGTKEGKRRRVLKGNFYITSLSTVSPSLTILGGPYLFCNTTFLPFGPKVTPTSSATMSTPACIQQSKPLLDNEDCRRSSSGSGSALLRNATWSFFVAEPSWLK